MAISPHVFISHTTHDRRDLTLAQTIAAGLRSRGAAAWIAPDRIPPGASWEREINEAILNKCNHFIVILSAASLEAPWVQREIELARQRRELDQTFQILPLPVGETGSYPEKAFLSQFQNLKYFDNPEDQVQEVAKVLGLPVVAWVEYLRNVVREFGSISLVPGQKSVSVEDLPAIGVSRIGQNADSSRTVESHEVADLLRVAPKAIVVGPAGSGKTTALQLLAYRQATLLLGTSAEISNASVSNSSLVPVFVDLGGYSTDLLSLIRETLTNRRVPVNDVTLRSELSGQRILLLLDGFDEVANKRKLLSDLEQLSIFASDTPIILTTRLVSPLNNKAFNGFAQFDVDVLDNSQIHRVFDLLLDHATSESLLHRLEDKNLIEAFRQPLTACLLATSNPGNEEQFLPMTKGALYSRILNYLVKHWEAQRYDQLVVPDALAKISCLNRIGHVMTSNNYRALSEERMEELCREEMRSAGVETTRQVGLTEELFATGLLKRFVDGVSFSHLSFRDFFAANWLMRNFSLRTILALSWQRQWHDALVYLVGLLSDSQASKILYWMVKFSRVSIAAARFNPFVWSADQILLTLNCLGNTNQALVPLKDELISRLKGNIYLSRTTVTPDLTLPHGINSIYAYFCVLVGRLRTPRSLEFLKQFDSRQLRVFGLAQFWDIEVLLQEFQDPDTSDGGVADDLAADFILRFPTNSVVDTILGFLSRSDLNEKQRLLKSLNHCLSNTEARQQYNLLAEDHRWFPTFLDIALRSDNSEVRDSALAIIRSFGESQFFLPKPAEETVATVAREDSDDDVRMRAIWALTYAKSDVSLDILKEFVRSGSEWLTLTSLDALRYRDRKNFPSYMADAIARLYDGVLKQDAAVLVEKLLESIDSDDPTLFVDARIKEILKHLIAGAVLSEWYLVRSFSAEALFITEIKQVAPVLSLLLSLDGSESVREKALLGLEALLDRDAEPYIYKAFEDPSPLVRKMALTSFYRLPEELGVRAIAKLQEISQTDSDSGIRITAENVAERFIKGDRW